MREYIWTFPTTEKACAVAVALSQQNEEGRQALHCQPRRFVARGFSLYASPCDPLPNPGDEQVVTACRTGRL